MALVSYLVSQGVISEDTVQTLDLEKIETTGGLETTLLDSGVDEDALRQAMAAYYNVPAFSLSKGFTIAADTLRYIPEDSAVHYKVAPLEVADGVLLVGSNTPDNLQLREVLNFIGNKHDLTYKLVFLLQKDVTSALEFYTNLKNEVDDALDSLETELNSEIEENSKSSEKANRELLEHIKEDAPVTKIVATILRYAVDGKASDIHVEPGEKKLTVRYRVDGLLATSLELPTNIQNAVVARIKILTSMRLDEKRRPQDGRFSATFDGRRIDFRVSILPTSHGEKVVMRILDTAKGVSSLNDIGVNDYHMEVIKKVIKEPYGIILISGPTGSGKSTTLYAMLGEVDRQGKNVLSLEDPVEYDIAGVSQSQVRPEIGYTFAHGLRAALRQDPDIIMVGEIRDKETAQLAIQAALTGHLVLSTIHTNNSIGVIPRLIDMGIDPYLIAPTLKLAIAQRLARKLTPGTGREEPVDKSTQMMIDETFSSLPKRFHHKIPTSTTVMHPVPSPESSTGLRGRTAVMEILEINNEMQDLILRNASEEDLFNQARSHGFMTMQEEAISKALKHEIPYEEMLNFGSKVGLDVIDEELPGVEEQKEEDVTTTKVAEDDVIGVDNSPVDMDAQAIINGNENTAT